LRLDIYLQSFAPCAGGSHMSGSHVTEVTGFEPKRQTIRDAVAGSLSENLRSGK
jgi:hypothetical protein